MDPKALSNLRLDVRLQQRTGWIPDVELNESLDALPDVRDKMAEDDEAPPPASPGDASSEV